ncbi:MAG TPA: 50S ribosomal protein L4 [Candidatus Bathyarchaeia archaeon]|nr:50S ribosomal protein L4 [Candidatus Bathyarchaeia archaeon]
MPKVDVLSIQGRKIGLIELPKEIFGAKVNEELMTQAVRVYLSNQRKSKAKTKRRGEVRGSRRKIWRQKGTGRARHGDRYAPIFVGGGVAHGPTGEENWKRKLTKKMRCRALFSALTSKLKAKEVLIIQGLEKVEPKTKEMVKIIANLKLKKKDKEKNKISVVLPEVLENVIRAGRNIPNLNLKQANLLNTYEVLNGGKLIFMKDSIEKIRETFLKEKN